MRIGNTLPYLMAIMIIGTACGCADLFGVLDHFVGNPEPSPPLGEAFVRLFEGSVLLSDGRPIPPDINGGQATNINDVGQLSGVLQPAKEAGIADLAGTWVHAAGYGAIHIDPSGRIFQADVADSFGGERVPEIVPRTLFNVGTARVTPDGRVEVDASIFLFGLSASASMAGTLDSTHNVIYGVIADMTVNRGNGPEYGTDYLPWLRWDAEAGTLAMGG